MNCWGNRHDGSDLHRQGHSENVRIQGRTDSPEDHAGNGTHREPAVGHGTGGQNLDGKEDLAAGKRNAADYQKKGGVRDEVQNRPLLLLPDDSKKNRAAGHADGSDQTAAGAEKECD